MNFQFEALWPTLRIVVLVFLLIFALLILGLIVFIEILPGKIAIARSHPQADAIAVCGWVGLPSGILWAVALVWAFLRPTSSPESGTSTAGIAGDSILKLIDQIDSLERIIVDKSEENQGVVVAAFSQKNFLRIKSGQYAEVALHSYPGEILTGRVLDTIDNSGAGQLTASGDIPTDLGGNQPTQFAVRIKLDRGEELRLPGGSQALAAVYTEDMQIAGLPVMFLIRAQSWLKYIL